jgi:hypothetical protein
MLIGVRLQRLRRGYDSQALALEDRIIRARANYVMLIEALNKLNNAAQAVITPVNELSKRLNEFSKRLGEKK